MILSYTNCLFSRRPSFWMTENKIKAAWSRWHLAFVLPETVDPTGLIRGFLWLFCCRTHPPSWRLKNEKLHEPYQCCGSGHWVLRTPFSWNETLCWKMTKLWAWTRTQLLSLFLWYMLSRQDDLGQARCLRECVRLHLTMWRVKLGNFHVLDWLLVHQ